MANTTAIIAVRPKTEDDDSGIIFAIAIARTAMIITGKKTLRPSFLLDEICIFSLTSLLPLILIPSTREIIAIRTTRIPLISEGMTFPRAKRMPRIIQNIIVVSFFSLDGSLLTL